MRYPKDLPAGGTLGLVAPSFGCATQPYKDRLDEALIRLTGRGYSLCLGPNCYEGKGVGISNEPALCGKELNDMFLSSGADAILSVGGGELMCEVLDHVDFEAIAGADPLWYMGFSDNTNLTFLLPTLCDTAAVYGPLATAYAMADPHPSLGDALGLLSGSTRSVSSYPFWEREDIEGGVTEGYNLTEPFEAKLTAADGSHVSSLSMSGRLLGGCLDCLVTLCGTKYDRVKEFGERYAADGVIWFLECCDLTTMAARRALWQLRHAGWFDHAAGFLIGRPFLWDNACCGLEWEDAVLAPLSGLGVPVIRDLDLGHLPPMMPLISGGAAEVTAVPGKVTLHFTGQ